ncbi:MAG: adenosine kinase [Desulfobacteraceae bacterium 4572_19]|nr:MAG: adenosine kinase [Desulfobacteraceae bacterium 4572_19]
MLKNSDGGKLITGIGSALIDILVHESDEFLNSISDIKGGMTLVDEEFIQNIYLKMKKKSKIVPGGATCNTIVGIAQLGGEARFIGKRGRDEFGDFFEDEINKCGVEPQLLKSSTSSGRVLSIITPDAQRSMFTYLGASSEMIAEEISKSIFDGAKIVLIEGYLLFNTRLIFAALKAAKASGALIAMDLASFTVVEESKEILTEIVNEYVDILMANEDEAAAFTGTSNEHKSLELLAQNVNIAILKVGKRGSYISQDGKVFKVEPKGDGTAVDTTGAGDLWAAGFLYGFVNGYPLEKCGELGSACGHAVCQVVGASIPNNGWQIIRQMINK